MKDNVLVKKFNKENVLTIMLVLFLILWRIPFLNKGIDYTDTGFSMENYKNMFLGEGIRGIGRFYTVVLGGFIYKLLPAYHLLVYRILHWVLNLCTYYFAYKIFEKRLNRNLVLIGLFAISFGAKSGEALFSYYPLTSCLLLLSIWLLVSGATEKNNIKMLLSGFVSGLNVFVRLPNALFLSMVIAAVIYFMQSGEGVKKSLRRSFWYVSGAAAALVISILVMWIVMGADGVTDSFMSYVRMALGQKTPGVKNFLGIDEVSHHSLFANIYTVAVQVWKSIKSMVIIAPTVLFAFASDKLLSGRLSKNVIKVIKIAVCLIIFCLTGSLLANSIYHTLYIASLLSGVIVVFLFRKENSEIVMLNVIAILVSICSVFGSDAGMTRMSMINTMLVIVLVYNVSELGAKFINSQNTLCKSFICALSNLKTVVILAVIVVGIVNILPKTYNDADFSELNYPVNEEIKVLNGMKTSEKRAEQINEYYSIMSSAELKDKEVAIFGYFPLGAVIGNQKDYFEPVQPCIDYPGVSVTKLLGNIEKKNAQGIKPVIVVSYVNMQQTNSESFTSEAKQAVLNYMLSLYDYETYSDSKNFTVYKPVE